MNVKTKDITDSSEESIVLPTFSNVNNGFNVKHLKSDESDVNGSTLMKECLDKKVDNIFNDSRLICSTCNSKLVSDLILSVLKERLNEEEKFQGSKGIEKLNGKDRENTILSNGINNDDNTKVNMNELSKRIEVYYFDHGNSAYYNTTDESPILITQKYAEKSDQAATLFWAEIFGTIHIGITFLTAFILQFFKFILFSLIRPLTIGIIQLLADYFIKPFLSIIFNSFIQPILILLYNIAMSFRDLCQPIAESLGFFLQQFANFFRSIRFIEINQQK